MLEGFPAFLSISWVMLQAVCGTQNSPVAMSAWCPDPLPSHGPTVPLWQRPERKQLRKGMFVLVLCLFGPWGEVGCHGVESRWRVWESVHSVGKWGKMPIETSSFPLYFPSKRPPIRWMVPVIQVGESLPLSYLWRLSQTDLERIYWSPCTSQDQLYPT